MTAIGQRNLGKIYLKKNTIPDLLEFAFSSEAYEYLSSVKRGQGASKTT
jgi:Holliday junction resolvase